MQRVSRVVEVDEGYLFMSPDGPGMREKVLRLIDFERKCCSFLSFSLEQDSRAKEVGIRITGEKSTLKLMAKDLGLVPTSKGARKP